MPKRKRSPNDQKIKRRRAPGITVQSMENKLIGLAVNLAATQMRKGTASSQVITHFLKLGSTQAQLEKVKLEQENLLLQAKTEALKSQKKVEELYSNAMKAFSIYKGDPEKPDDD